MRQGTVINPKGPEKSYDPNQPFNIVHSKRGGSFLCNEVYCSSYRVAARMATSYDTGQDHSGFRCVMTKEMWETMKKKCTTLKMFYVALNKYCDLLFV